MRTTTSRRLAFAAFEGPDSDTDTVAAIVGGVVAACQPETIPTAWLDATESWSIE